MTRSLAPFLIALGSLAVSVRAATPQPPGEMARAMEAELNRRPAVTEKPVAPAHNSTVRLNPPAFVWLPPKKRPTGYVLALSRSRDFTKGAATEFPAPISVHIPTEPLAAGTWHWRVGVRLPDKAMAWSKTRTFTVAEDAQAWPFPRMDDLAAKVPKEHPRLLFPRAHLATARRHAKGMMRRELDDLVKRAKRAVGEELVAEPDPLKRGPERGPHAVHIMRTTRPPMDRMEDCALAYLLAGDKALGQEAKRRLLYFFSWDPQGPTGLFAYDEPAMWVMQRGTRAYDWTYDLFTPAERARIEPVMKVRSQQFLRRLNRMPFESRPYSSHPARDVGFLGEAAICFIHEWPEARDWLAYVLKIYWSVFPAWAQDDGGWQEGPGYWRAYMGFAIHFAAALQQATGEQITRKPFFHNTPYYCLYTNPPYAKMSPFGDGQHGAPSRSAGWLMYAFSTLNRDPYIRWYPDAMRSGPGAWTLGFALADPTLKAKPPTDLPQARRFPGAGLVAMHSSLGDAKDDAYLVLRSSPFGSVSHGHADQNAFVIEAYGEALAIATGYYPWYGSPHHANWTRSTKAKNAITYDGGKGQTIRSWNATGRIVEFLHGPHYDYALADATRAYSGRLVKCLRHVIHVRPGIFAILDEVEAPKPVTWEWWLHALDQMQVDAKTREVLTRRGDARLLTSFIEPQALTFAQTDQFTPPPEYSAKQKRKYRNQWHLTAATKEKAKSAVFLTVLRPHRAAGEGKLPRLRRIAEKGVVGVTWEQDGESHTILFGDKGVTWGGVRTDGRLVAVRTRKGAAPAWLVHQATKLALDGQTVLSADQSITKASASAAR